MATSSNDGLGLEYGTVRLERSRAEWSPIAGDLARRVALALGIDAVSVEHVGSTAVPGMLAKPVVDIAVGIRREAEPQSVRHRLNALGWIYRGDAGEDGGHVFVLEREPQARIAHLHVVEYGKRQWRQYLALRDRLRSDPVARSTYERAKLALVDEHGSDNTRRVYTLGKTAIIGELLDNHADGDLG